VVRQAEKYASIVVVVDDGSSDDTAAVARSAGALVVDHGRNRGYGGALKTAFKEAARLDADHLVVLDADGQHDPGDIPRLVQAQVHQDAEIVIGSRYVDGSRTEFPLVRRIGLGVINVLTNLSLGRLRPRDFIHDTQSGYRCYDREAIESLAAEWDIGDRMGASTDIIYHAHRRGYDVSEVGITMSYEVEHGSTMNPFSHGYDLVRNIFYTLTVVHPFKTLGVVGAVLASLGTGIALEGVALGIETGQVPFVKTYAAALVALLGMIVAIVAIEYHTLRSHPYYRRTRD
jgi:glycosyltransferase involved in cell wall biosynthesis